MSFLNWLELFQPVAPAGATVTADAPCAQEYLAAQHLESGAPLDWLAGQRSDPSASFETLAAMRADHGMPLTSAAMSSGVSGFPVGIGGKVASNTAEALEVVGSAATDWCVVTEWSVSFLGDVPATAEWQGTIMALPTADAIVPIEWSALPGPMRVSLERLLASPGRRRLLTTPGRLRLLKRP
jgi:hypothetical protein